MQAIERTSDKNVQILLEQPAKDASVADVLQRRAVNIDVVVVERSLDAAERDQHC